MTIAANTNGLKLTAIWAAASIVWLATVAWQAWATWPALPLDLSAQDAATQTAYDAAVSGHVVRAALFGFGIPVAVYALGWLACRMRR